MGIRVDCGGVEHYAKCSSNGGERVYLIDHSKITERVADIYATHPTMGEQYGVIQVAAQLRSAGVKEIFLHFPYMPYSASPAMLEMTRVFLDLVYAVSAKSTSTWFLPPWQPTLSRRLVVTRLSELLSAFNRKHPGYLFKDGLVLVAACAEDIVGAEVIAEMVGAEITVNLRSRPHKHQLGANEIWFQSIVSENDRKVPAGASILSIHAMAPKRMGIARHMSFTYAGDSLEHYLEVF